MNSNLLARNLLILTVGEAASRVIYAIAFVYLVRTFPPNLYGSVEITLSLILILMIIVDMGLGVIGTREIARKPDQTVTLLRHVVAMQIWLAGAIFAFLLIYVWIVPFESTLRYLLVGYGASLLFYPFIVNWIFQGWKRMAWVSIPQVVRQLIFAILVLFWVRDPAQVYLLPVFEILAVAAAVALNILGLTKIGSRLIIDLMKGWNTELFRLAAPIGGAQLIWAFRMYLPLLALGVIAGQAAAGYFGAPHRIVMVLQALLAVYFVNLFPSMSQVSSLSGRSLIELINNSLRFSVWPSLLLALVVAAGAPWLIQLAFGELYSDSQAVQVLAILIWMIPILVWRGHGHHALISINHQQDSFVCSVVGLVLLLVGLLILIPPLAETGAALAMVASEILASALTWWRLKVRLPGTQLLQNIWHLPSLKVFKENFGRA